MKSDKRFILVFVVTAIVAFGLVMLIKGNFGHDQKESSLKHKDVYYCPMHPQIISDKPGECPICYMKLVKRETGSGNEGQPGVSGQSSAAGHANIELNLQKQQLIGIKTSPVTRQVLSKAVRTVGTVAHDPELYQAQTEYLRAIQTLKESQVSGSSPEIIEQLESLVEASKIRLRHMGISIAMIAAMADWKEPQHNLLFAHPGQPVWVYASIYEYELPLVQVDDEVDVEIPARQGELFKGKIWAIDEMVDQMTRSTRVRIQVEDPNGKLKPDTYVNVIIHVDLGDTLTIPREAVFETGTQRIVFVDLGDGKLEARDVVLGARTEDFYEVKQGLKENEMIVTSGNFLIDSESRLKAALEGMTDQGMDDQPQTIEGGQHVH